jgi:hypothetical protein
MSGLYGALMAQKSPKDPTWPVTRGAAVRDQATAPLSSPVDMGEVTADRYVHGDFAVALGLVDVVGNERFQRGVAVFLEFAFEASRDDPFHR